MNQENKTFESGMARLEQIVRALERGDVPLDDSLKLFQEGTQLVNQCQKLLDDAKLQVQMVLTDSEGKPVMEDIEDAES